MRIERISPDETKNLYHCMKQIDSESQFMLYTPDERDYKEDSLRDRIKHNFYIGLKTDDGDIKGYSLVHISSISKIKHIGYIVTGIEQAYHHKGYATQMFDEIIKWSKRKGLRRLELTVLTHNNPAIKLYEKIGFKIEGIKRQSIYMDGLYHDELYMALLLDESPETILQF
ncbi:GNAT family N-acetyltransferase [Staphylococcus sp. SQ8-PEA]|uniref:GNAT family N-acetyltransferase n=1 Tax=Staphylococcus marylandisciuri TaxID=2981529 RepID=A0ABT2QN00_9STAP|nr:GNAT family protein [Staphylococcus marylandisciuri]MCU5745356.1 GNAT family N-acetyltransferase [Staphylococcus marylandisciuri]